MEKKNLIFPLLVLKFHKWHFYKDLFHYSEKLFYFTLTLNIMQTHSGWKGGHFFMLDSSYDKQLKYASGALGLVGLKSLKYFYGEKIIRWKTTLLLWGKVHSNVQYSGHTSPLLKHKYTSDALLTCTFPTYLWVCLHVQCLHSLYCIWPHLLFLFSSPVWTGTHFLWICKNQNA